VGFSTPAASRPLGPTTYFSILIVRVVVVPQSSQPRQSSQPPCRYPLLNGAFT
jgi:hypothetical protein